MRPVTAIVSGANHDADRVFANSVEMTDEWGKAGSTSASLAHLGILLQCFRIKLAQARRHASYASEARPSHSKGGSRGTSMRTCQPESVSPFTEAAWSGLATGGNIVRTSA
jgi:hypothetical protein